MPAQVAIKRWCDISGAPVKTDITNQNTLAVAQDVHAVSGDNNPVQLNIIATVHSYWVSTRLCALTAPAGTINNIRWYTEESLGTGVTCVGQESSSYVQATGTPGTGIELTTGNHAGLSGAPVDVATLTSSSPLSVPGTISGPATGDFGHFVVYQFAVANTATPGISTALTFAWGYDET